MTITIGRHHHGSTRGQYPAQCSVCGVPWPRSKMQRTTGGLLVCPDDVGPDAALLDKLNARGARSRGEPKAAPDLYVEPYSDPATILGEDLHAWFDVRDMSGVEPDERFARRLRNMAGSGDMWPHSSPTIARWLYVPQNAVAGGPALVGDSGTAFMRTREGETTSVPQGRLYFWCVGGVANTAARERRLFGLQRAGAAGYVALLLISAATSKYQAVLTGEDGNEQINGPDIDTNLHLFEYGFRSTSAARFVVDGVDYAGARTGQAVGEGDLMSVGAGIANLGWDGPFCEAVVSSAEPSAAALSRMRTYFAAKYLELDIA